MLYESYVRIAAFGVELYRSLQEFPYEVGGYIGLNKGQSRAVSELRSSEPESYIGLPNGF